MPECPLCNIVILDAAPCCPLCKTPLDSGGLSGGMYPNERVQLRKYLMFSRMYLFIIVLAGAFLALLNMVLESEIWWSAIAGLALFYSYLVLRYAVIGRSGHRSKAFVLILIGVLSAIAADFVLGYRGWAIDFILPAGILSMDIVLLVCMLINRRNWQSYISWLCLMLALSLLPALFFLTELERYWYIACAPALITALLLLGGLALGGERALSELRRRFHIN